jgi:hypothetical protein
VERPDFQCPLKIEVTPNGCIIDHSMTTFDLVLGSVAYRVPKKSVFELFEHHRDLMDATGYSVRPSSPKPTPSPSATPTPQSTPATPRKRPLGKVEIPMKAPKSLEGIISALGKKHRGNVHAKGIVIITSKSVDDRRECRRDHF